MRENVFLFVTRVYEIQEKGSILFGIFIVSPRLQVEIGIKKGFID